MVFPALLAGATSDRGLGGDGAAALIESW